MARLFSTLGNGFYPMWLRCVHGFSCELDASAVLVHMTFHSELDKCLKEDSLDDFLSKLPAQHNHPMVHTFYHLSKL